MGIPLLKWYYYNLIILLFLVKTSKITIYRLPDLSEGKPGVTDPLKAYSWQELRGIIYREAEKL